MCVCVQPIKYCLQVFILDSELNYFVFPEPHTLNTSNTVSSPKALRTSSLSVNSNKKTVWMRIWKINTERPTFCSVTKYLIQKWFNIRPNTIDSWLNIVLIVRVCLYVSPWWRGDFMQYGFHRWVCAHVMLAQIKKAELISTSLVCSSDTSKRLHTLIQTFDRTICMEKRLRSFYHLHLILLSILIRIVSKCLEQRRRFFI